MFSARTLLGAAALSLSLSTAASAHTIIFAAALVPEGGPGATGTGNVTVTFDTDTFMMHVEASFSGTSGTTSAAHIHCCQTTPGTPANVGVATTLPSFPGFPLGVTSGNFDMTFDMSQASSWNPAFVTASGDINGAFNSLVVALEQGRAYFNVHTSTFPGGEIRAHLAEVPEPASAAMVALGLAVLASRRRARA